MPKNYTHHHKKSHSKKKHKPKVAMKEESILKSYQFYAPIYDKTFGWLLNYNGREMAAELTNNQPGTVLEVGVGTGIGLPFYRKEHEVHGIDISPHMLELAQQRVKKQKLKAIKKLSIMDARNLDYPDNTFDSVVAAYVMSVVPEPTRVLSEIARVCKPGGNVIIVNHFIAEKGPLYWIEHMLAPFANKLGWRPDMPVEEVLGHPDLYEIHRRGLSPMGLFTLLHLKKRN